MKTCWRRVRPISTSLTLTRTRQATTFYTSGTTGAPKGVYFSHRQMVLHTISELAAFGMAPKQGRFRSESVYMPITPMFHVHAWGFPYAATAAGAKQVYPGRYVPDQLLKLIKNEGVTFTHCVPTILLMLLDAPASADTDLSGLTMVIGGAALPKMLALRAMARGIDVFTGYGMSETGPILTLAHLKASMLSGVADEEVNFRTKTGRPIPLVDIRVVDSDMKDVAHDGKSSGEIVVRAPWLTQGYYQNPTASEDLWHGGYMHTNDIANMSPHGYLQITDRIKDVIKSGGEWISSLELEDIIMKAPGVKEAAVIAVKDEKWGERPVALVVRDYQAEEAPTENAIKAHVGAFATGRHFEIRRSSNHLVRRSARANERGEDRQESASSALHARRIIRGHLSRYERARPRFRMRMTMNELTMSNLQDRLGSEIGVSDWMVVDQERINEFAECTGDHQWIHVDVERAKRESPFGAVRARLSDPVVDRSAIPRCRRRSF